MPGTAVFRKYLIPRAVLVLYSMSHSGVSSTVGPVGSPAALELTAGSEKTITKMKCYRDHARSCRQILLGAGLPVLAFSAAATPDRAVERELEVGRYRCNCPLETGTKCCWCHSSPWLVCIMVLHQLKRANLIQYLYNQRFLVDLRSDQQTSECSQVYSTACKLGHKLLLQYEGNFCIGRQNGDYLDMQVLLCFEFISACQPLIALPSVVEQLVPYNQTYEML